MESSNGKIKARVIPAEEPDEASVGGVFRRYGVGYLSKHKLSWRQLQAFRAIRDCRTGLLGTRADTCADCGTLRLFHCSCGDRHCPLCQYTARQRWFTARYAELLPVPYFHGVFTLPHEYNQLVPYNEALLYKLMFRTSADILLRAGRAKLGGELGLTALLHTWTQLLKRHVHVHFIIPGGALTPSGKWHSAASGSWLFDVKELMRAFRKSLSRRLKSAWTRGTLQLPPHLAHLNSRSAFHAFVDAVAEKSWEVYLKPPFAGPEKVLEYLTRYTHRVAISDGRILDTDHHEVQFNWRDSRDNARQKTEALPAEEFIERFMMHILPRRFTKIRYYGFLGGRDRKAHLAAARAALGVTEASALAPAPQLAMVADDETKDLSVCPVCGGRMHLAPRTLRGRTAWLLATGPPTGSPLAHVA